MTRDNIDNNKITKKTLKIDLEYQTSHLKGFDDLKGAIGLIGEEYTIIYKSIWYGVLSTKNAKARLKVGGLKTDGRIHPLIVLKSGNGKHEIKTFIEKCMKADDKNCILPTSYHPEQFIGKTRSSKETGVEFIPGHLSADYILIDEGKDLLMSKDSFYAECRKYLRMAMDPHPDNTVYKKQVDNRQDEALSYSPHCCICIFLQPYTLPSIIATDGDLRRFTVPYTSISETEADPFMERLFRMDDDEEALNNFIDFFKPLEEYGKFIVTPEALAAFAKLSTAIRDRGYSRSQRSWEYMQISKYVIQNNLLKFCAIQALQDGTNEIIQRHVELAFIDYFEIMEHTYDFVETKIDGSLDYGDDWKGAVEMDRKALGWLYKNNALSESSSSVSIAQYKKILMKIFNVSERTVGRYIKKYRARNWIETKKGKHDSKVWLKFEPESSMDIHDRVVRGDTDPVKTYKNVTRKYTPLKIDEQKNQWGER